jgi:lysophospholipase L1-like esterase
MKSLKNILLGMGLILWTLVCFEVGIRVISNFTPNYVVEMLKYTSKLMIHSTIPHVTHEHKPNSSAHLMGVDIKLNSLGHRNPDLKEIKKPNEKRIHVIGSSLALGWGVNEEEGFVNLIESKLNKDISPKTNLNYVMSNAGVGNYNTFYQVELFEKQVGIIKPDVVILQYFINDAEPNAVQTNGALIKHSLLAGFLYKYFLTYSMGANKSLESYYLSLYKDDEPSWKNTKSSLLKFKQICNERGITSVALMIPNLSDLSKNSGYPSLYGKIERIFQQSKIPVIDTFSALSEAFENNSISARVASDDPHPSPSAHKIIADELYKFLLAQKIKILDL